MPLPSAPCLTPPYPALPPLAAPCRSSPRHAMPVPCAAVADRGVPRFTMPLHAEPRRGVPSHAVAFLAESQLSVADLAVPFHAIPHPIQPGPTSARPTLPDPTAPIADPTMPCLAATVPRLDEVDDRVPSIGWSKITDADQPTSRADDLQQRRAVDVLGQEHHQVNGRFPAFPERRALASDGVALDQDPTTVDVVSLGDAEVGQFGDRHDAGLVQVHRGLAWRAWVLAEPGGTDDRLPKVLARKAEIAVVTAVDVRREVVGLLGLGVLGGRGLRGDRLVAPAVEQDRGRAADGDGDGVRLADSDRVLRVVADRFDSRCENHGTSTSIGAPVAEPRDGSAPPTGTGRWRGIENRRQYSRHVDDIGAVVTVQGPIA